MQCFSFGLFYNCILQKYNSVRSNSNGKRDNLLPERICDCYFSDYTFSFLLSCIGEYRQLYSVGKENLYFAPVFTLYTDK